MSYPPYIPRNQRQLSSAVIFNDSVGFLCVHLFPTIQNAWVYILRFNILPFSGFCIVMLIPFVFSCITAVVSVIRYLPGLLRIFFFNLRGRPSRCYGPVGYIFGRRFYNSYCRFRNQCYLF